MKSRSLSLLCLLLLINIGGCYIIKQGTGQFKLQLSQKPIEDAIKEASKDEYKNLLRSVPSIRSYATENLFLKPTENYTTYLEVKGEGVSYVVTASPKTNLEPYTWWFPVIGSVPYKGYFDKKDALELEADLKSKGLDTYLFAAPAYSTLGWFKDPVTTPMLRRGKFSLASTIIHEMVHSTLYVEGQGDFNEQLASFIGFQGAMDFFTENHVLSEKQLKLVLEKKQRRKRFLYIIRAYTVELNELYASNITQKDKLEGRERIFNKLSIEAKKIYPGSREDFWKFNNARLLQYKRYDEDSELLLDFWEKSKSDWQKFWVLVNQHVKDSGWSS